MGSYGRNFDYRIMPFGGGRGSRYMLTTATKLPIGVPVIYDSSVDTTLFGNGVVGVVLATGAQAPQEGLSGIGVYEHAPAAYAGFDPVTTTYSDIDFIPAGKLCQVVTGKQVKVVLTNTTAKSFLHNRTYPGRIMVSGVGGATPAEIVGTFLTPGTGNDSAGYWDATATPADAWLVVTAVDNTNTEVEAKMVF